MDPLTILRKLERRLHPLLLAVGILLVLVAAAQLAAIHLFWVNAPHVEKEDLGQTTVALWVLLGALVVSVSLYGLLTWHRSMREPRVSSLSVRAIFFGWGTHLVLMALLSWAIDRGEGKELAALALAPGALAAFVAGLGAGCVAAWSGKQGRFGNAISMSVVIVLTLLAFGSPVPMVLAGASGAVVGGLLVGRKRFLKT
jgi:hypothetical protein